MQPQPSTSSGTPSTAACTSGGGSPKATDGVQDVLVVASTSGSPPPPSVQQHQKDKQLIFNYPATFQQCHQLFAMTCGVKLLRCDAGVPADLRSVRKVEEESDTDSSSSDDDDVKVFSAPRPQPAAPSAQNGETERTKKKGGKRVIQRKSSSRCCTICRKTFNSLANLKAHMQRRHAGDKRYRCNNCGASYWNRSTLSMHKKRMTEQNGVCSKKMSGDWRPKGPWTCTICGKRFKHAWYYGTHMRIHGGERPFKCEVCGKAFPIRGGLFQHRRIHTGKWPYNCVFCDRGFLGQSTLFRHLRCHTEEKPYFCNEEGCGASFRDMCDLNRHKKMVHLKKY